MPDFKAICRIDRPILKGILDLGDEVLIEIIRYEKDTVIAENSGAFNTYNKDGTKAGIEYRFPTITAAAGSFKGYRFKSKNGNYYNDNCIRNRVGPLQLDQIFDKVEK